MPIPPHPDPTIAEQFRQQFAAAVDQIWTAEWSRRTEADGRRWFQHAWRDTRTILEQTPPAPDESLAPYVRRIRTQLKAIEWHYAYGDADDAGCVDEEGWYAGVIHTIVGILNRMELDTWDVRR